MSNGNNSNADFTVKRHSVTAGDVGQKGQPLWQFLFGAPLGGKSDIPGFWHPRRDAFLRGTIYKESLWASAVHIAITKKAAQGWELKGDQKRLVSRWQELLLACDGNLSWVAFLQKQLMDYVTTGNGQFFEIVRQSNARGAKIIGLMHLDSLRMTRTGDLRVPFLYRDRLNRIHELKHYQCLALSDSPDPSETWYGVGHCSAERGWAAIRKLSAMEQYLYEKVSGRRALAVHIVGGMSEASYRAAVTASQEEASQKGAVIYMGSTVIPVMGDVAPTLVTIPLASMPDGFNRKEEFDIGVLQYADALGIDVQDLQPLTGRAIGTGAQSRVLDDKAAGKGLVAWRLQFMHMLNQFVVPEKVTFYFMERDQTERQREADIKGTNAATVTGMVSTGLLMPLQGQQLLVQWDVLPKSMFPQYQDMDRTLNDEEKPEPDPTAEQLAKAREMEAALAALPKPGEQLPAQMGKDGYKIAPASKPDPFGGKPAAVNPFKKSKVITAKKAGGDDWELLPDEPDVAANLAALNASIARLEEKWEEGLSTKAVVPDGGEEEEVTTEEAMRLALDSFMMGMKAQAQNTPQVQASAGPQFRLEGVHMDAPPEMIEAFQRMQAPQINVPAPVVNVAPALVTVNVPRQEAPKVQVDVAAPVVNIPPAQVTVNVPRQEAPRVTVNVPKADVLPVAVQPAGETTEVITVVRGPDRLIDRLIKRTK